MPAINDKLSTTVQASVACADNYHKRISPMRAFVCLAAMLAFLPALTVRAQPAGSAYAVDYDRLYRVDLSTRQASLIGEVSRNGPQFLGDLSGLTTATDGRLFVASDAAKSLLRIDPDNGDASVVGLFGVAAGGDPAAPLDYAMAAACDGGLWLASATTEQLWRVDPDTAQSTLIGSIGHAITGLAVRGNVLYGTGGRGDEGLYRIDTSSAAATRIGTGYGSDVPYAASVSPAFNAGGELLAMINYVPPAPGDPAPVAPWSDLATIDLETGIANVHGEVVGPTSLRGIGLRGFSLGPPQCTAAPPIGNASATAIPSSSEWSLLLQVIGIGLLATLVLRRRVVMQRR